MPKLVSVGSAMRGTAVPIDNIGFAAKINSMLMRELGSPAKLDI